MGLANNIAVHNTPAVIYVNFDALKMALEHDVKKYDILVTSDTVADAKKLATELNQTKTIIDNRRKEETSKASKEILEFGEQMKELVSMCENARLKILDQVSVFENKRREEIRSLLEDYLAKALDLNSVDQEFRTVRISNLVKLSSATASGKLTSGAKREIESMVLANKSLQDQTERRLLMLENQSYRAGLKAPLERAHVEVFLFENDDNYQKRLDAILTSEVARQEKAKEALRADIADDANRSPEAIVERAPLRKDYYQQASMPKPARRTAPVNGKTHYTITCTFDIETPSSVTVGAIESHLRKKMGEAGITSLSSVDISQRGEH